MLVNPYRIGRGPGLATTASGVAQQGICANYATTGLSENKRRKKKRKASEEAVGNVERKMHTHKGWYLKYRNNDWKGRELTDIMKRRNVDILCLRETKWKGSKTRNIGGGCKQCYNRADGRKNGIGIVVKEELVESFLEVKRVSYRLRAAKQEVKGSILNIVSAYPPQVNNSMEEKIIGKIWMG